MKPALCIIDLQNEFFEQDEVTARSFSQAMQVIRMAQAIFRKKGLPVVVVQHQDEETGLMPGSSAFDVPEQIEIAADDLRIVKTYGNAFNRTPLLSELKQRGVDTLIISGYCAEYCVLNTCRGAKDVDLVPILLRGALASGHPHRIPFVEEINEVISIGALSALLG